MSADSSNLLQFADTRPAKRSVSGKRWKMLIVDDDLSVHEVTKLALQSFEFAGCTLEFLSAFSAAEALPILKAHEDIAVVLLDIVMESEDAGFQVVRHLRDRLNNQATRIILRTGQPGQAPAAKVVAEYDINDYKEKTELTATKLYTTVYTALRTYRDILALQGNRKGLETVIDATATMFQNRNIRDFAQGVLEQLTALLYLDREAVYCQTDGIAAISNDGTMEIVAATGQFSSYVGHDIDQLDNPNFVAAVREACDCKTSVSREGGLYATYFMTDKGHENVICVYGPSDNSGYVASLINLFLRNVSVAFDNIRLQEDLSQEIVERREAERDAAILARLPGELPEPVMRVSDDGKISYANAFSAPILEYLGASIGEGVLPEWKKRVDSILKTGRRFDMELTHKGRIFELSFSPIPEAGYVNVFGRDVTRFRELLQTLEHTAFHDHLTGIANRLYFKDQLEAALARGRRNGNLVGLMMLDLNKFKKINDAWGHTVGDLVLKEVATRLATNTREVDLIARIGGDEFSVVVTQLDRLETMSVLADRIQACFEEPVVVNGQSFSVGCAVGVSVFPNDAGTAEELQQFADLAMYHAKHDGLGHLSFFNQDLQKKARDKLDMEANLSDGLKTNRFEVFYQPLVNLIDGRVIGAEALLRLWQPDGTLVPPDLFIPIAEETGLIEPIGDWVMLQICSDINSWLAKGIKVPRVAFNLSGKQLHLKGLPDRIREILQTTGVPASLIEAEITESVLVGEEELSLRQLEQLREIGLTLAIDDFGTGYSSLSYLRHLPVSKLKIDRSFVADMLECDDATAIVDAIISLANSLRLRVLAEGIEGENQVAMLLSKGCVEGQGYHFARPMPCGEFEALLTGS